MKIAKKFVRFYRQSINPPYNKKDLWPIIGTIGILIAVPLVANTSNFKKDKVQEEINLVSQEVDTKFASNEILIKVKKPLRDKIKEKAKPTDTGVKSVDKKNKQLKVKKFERVIPEKDKKEDTDEEVLGWYKVTLPGKHQVVEGKINKVTGELSSENDKASRLIDLTDKYESDKNIVEAEPNFVVKILRTPNDPYYSSSGSWGQSYPDLWGIKKINSASAWDQTTGSTSVIVADIDTGVDRNHEDLQGQMWVNSAETPGNGVDDDGNGYIDDYYGWDWYNNDNNPMDDHGHGTHTVGTIAGVGNNSTGVVGVNWTGKIMALKFLSSGGSGYLSDGVAALRYAADMGAKVSSNSWGCTCNSTAMDDAVKYEHDKGMVMVAAAGNSNSDAIDHSPSSADRAIAVAATDYLDRKASFSSWGEDIDVAAPGVDVLSLKASVSPMCYASRTVGTRYCRVSGTSMATPHVAGLAALLLAKNPSLTNEEIRQILRHGATDLGAAGKDRNFGYGRISAAGSMNLASSNPLAPIITSLKSRSIVRGTSLQILGGVPGSNFANYKIEAGLGRAPTSWTTLATSTNQVINGVLATINTTQMNDGKYIFRITATDTANKKYQFQVHDVDVDNNIDTQPPTVNITSPSNGATVSGYINIVASATDNEGVTKVYFYVDGSLKRIDTSSPYTYYWNSASVNNGNRNLAAKAYDPTGNIGTSPTVTVKVSNEKTPPVANIISPTNGSKVSGYVNIVASATDNVGVKYVYFYIDGVWKRTDSSSPYTYYWNSTSVSNGSHNMYVRAVDTSNNVGTSPTVTVNVSNAPDTRPPTAPTRLLARVWSISQINLAWGASSDNVKVVGYKIYRNGYLIKRVAGTRHSDRLVRGGRTYTYYVRAYDVAGNVSARSNYAKVTTPSGAPKRKQGDLNGDTRINIRDLSIVILVYF
jgi:subtilisin family serine protease